MSYAPEDEVLITEAEYPYVGVYAKKPSGEQVYHLINVQDRTDVLPATVEFTDDPGK